MTTDLFYLEPWEALSDAERIAAARRLVASLPEGFSFNRVAVQSLGDQVHPVAFFDWEPVGWEHSEWYRGTFALVPGNLATLGYDRNHPFVPTESQLESWAYSQKEWGYPLYRSILTSA